MTSCLTELCVFLAIIKVRGHLVMSIIQFMNLISVHFWTYNTSLNNFLNYGLETRFWVRWSTAIFRTTLALLSSKFIKFYLGLIMFSFNFKEKAFDVCSFNLVRPDIRYCNMVIADRGFTDSKIRFKSSFYV